MKIPDGYTEEQVLEIFDRIMKRLCYSLRFGCHDENDIRQEGIMFGIEVLEKGKYDGKRPLDAFLYTCIKRLLMNNKRNKYSRIQSPCLQCPLYDPECLKSTNQCAAFEDKTECDKWNKWFTRNDSKRNLNHCVDIDDVDESHRRSDQDIVQDVDLKDRLEKINKTLPVSMRGDYLRMRDGESIPKARKDAIVKFIKDTFDAS